MKERPILFSGPIVQAILAGRKTQTRRCVAGIPGAVKAHWYASIGAAQFKRSDGRESKPVPCPYGQPGGRLWVRETWRAWPLVGAGDLWRVEFKSDGATRDVFPPSDWEPPKTLERQPLPWVPSIFLPRWASRITLEVTEVRVQRLQEISEEDAKAEGIERSNDPRWPYRNYDPLDGAPFVHATTSFMSLWDSINGERPGCSWGANPWVWAISFEVLP